MTVTHSTSDRLRPARWWGLAAVMSLVVLGGATLALTSSQVVADPVATAAAYDDTPELDRLMAGLMAFAIAAEAIVVTAAVSYVVMAVRRSRRRAAALAATPGPVVTLPDAADAAATVIAAAGSRPASAAVLASAAAELATADVAYVVTVDADDHVPVVTAFGCDPESPEVAEDVAALLEDPDLLSVPQRWLNAEGRDARAWMTVPLRSDGVVVGLVAVTRLGDRTYGIGDLDKLCRAAAVGLVALPPLVDTVTHLPTRRRLDLDLASPEHELAAADTPVGFLALAVDHGASRRHLLGDAAGDELLAQVADVVRAHLRLDDVLFRDGDDRLGALLPGATAAEAAEAAERVRRAVEDHRFDLAGEAVALTVSVGTVVDASGPSPELLARADRALDVAERYGRNRVMAHVA